MIAASVRALPLRARADIELLRRLCYLRALQARATRLALRRLPGDEARSRRLHLHIARSGPKGMEPERHEAEPARRAALAVDVLVRARRWIVARYVLFIAALVATGLALVLAASLFSSALRQRVFPTDLGRTAHWKTSSVLGPLPGQGTGTDARRGPDANLFFHTQFESDPHIDVDFGRPVRLREIRVKNRADCCGERALPLNVEALGTSGPRLLCQRRAPFRSWTCHAGGVVTQKIRVRVAGTNMLHLQSVEVYE